MYASFQKYFEKNCSINKSLTILKFVKLHFCAHFCDSSKMSFSCNSEMSFEKGTPHFSDTALQTFVRCALSSKWRHYAGFLFTLLYFFYTSVT